MISLVDPEVPYKFVVKARNLAGCGEKQQVYCFTREGGTFNLVVEQCTPDHCRCQITFQNHQLQ